MNDTEPSPTHEPLSSATAAPDRTRRSRHLRAVAWVCFAVQVLLTPIVLYAAVTDPLGDLRRVGMQTMSVFLLAGGVCALASRPSP